jgi:hypothetical protein
MKQLYKINVANGLDFEAIAECELILKANDNIVVQCERYMDFARVVEPIGDLIEDEKEFERQRAANSKGRHIEGAKIPMILRVANEDDLRQAEENDRQAFEAHNKTLERIRFHGLEMKLIQTHFSFDRKMIIFLFSADGRIDFRELLRDLSGLLKVRVELRQVGVRDDPCAESPRTPIRQTKRAKPSRGALTADPAYLRPSRQPSRREQLPYRIATQTPCRNSWKKTGSGPDGHPNAVPSRPTMSRQWNRRQQT